MLAVYKRELKSYFSGIIGYLYITFMLLIGGVYCALYNLINLYSNFEYVFYSIDFIYLLVVPLLTMRILAEERRQKTDQLLYSLPLKLSSVILGKYFALLTLMAVPIVILGAYPLLLSAFGEVALGTAYSSLLGFAFLGAALMAVGLFLSSLTENQIVAALLTFAAVLAFYLMGNIRDMLTTSAAAALITFSVAAVLLGLFVYGMTKDRFSSLVTLVIAEGAFLILYMVAPTWLETAFSAVLGAIALFGYMDNFVFGLFDIPALVLYASVAALFVFFSVQSMEKRRWS